MRLNALVDEAVAALAQIDEFSGEERRAIIALVAHPPIWTDAVTRAYSAVLQEMGARDFEWPEFDRWYTVFARRGVFPPLWDGLESPPCRGASSPVRQAYRERKLYLLIDWLHALVATRAEIRTALTRYARQGLRAEIARQSAAITCPACGPLNHGHVEGNARDVPPFHPGCRCLVLATNPTARRKPSYTHR